MKVSDNLYMERQQVPLILSWALTIQKVCYFVLLFFLNFFLYCQGSKLDCADVELGGCFDDGQAYVALSRVKDLNGLSLKGTDLSRITVHQSVKKFYETFDNGTFEKNTNTKKIEKRKREEPDV